MFIGEIITKFRLNNSQNRSIVLLLLTAFIVQAYIASWPDTMGDVKWYRSWSRVLVNKGLASAYWDNQELKQSNLFSTGIHIDYPPIYPYILYILGKCYKLFNPTSFASNDNLLDFFIKIPAALANILISLLIFIELKKKTKSKIALLISSAYAFNPAIIFATNYKGQTDSIYSLFVLLSVILLSNKRPEWSWVSITLAVFTKPLAYPFAPIIALFTLKQFGIKRTLRCALTSLVTTLLIFLPFIYLNRLSDIIHSLFFQVDAMPYISVYAHNIWWIIGTGLPWVHADIKPFGLISYRFIGIALFGVFYLVSLIKFWGSNNENSLYYLSASVAFGFFMLSTHIHERYLFIFFPLLSLTYIYDYRLKWIYIISTFSFLANLLLHDGLIINYLRPLSIGPTLVLPTEQGVGISLLRLFMTLISTQINILIFCYWIYYFYLRDKLPANTYLFEKGTELGRSSLIKIAAIVILFISLTSIPFIVKATRFAMDHYFIFNLGKAEKKTIKDDFIASYYFDINKDLRPVLYEHPSSNITYKLTLPEKAFLSFGIALSPNSWSPDKGDGVLFELYVQDGSVQERLFSKYIDPKNKIEDRRWHDEVVDLSRYGKKEVSLSFVTTPGPNNNTDFDWAGWSNPKLIPIN